MANPELNVRSELSKVITELAKIRDKADEVSKSLDEMGDTAGDAIGKKQKETETFFGKLTSIGRRTADQLKRDFMAMGSMASLKGAMNLGSMFGDSIQQTVSLSDTIRKLGTSFGVARQDFSKFQDQLTKGLGDIGMSSDEAAATLKGLAGSGVQGAGNVTEYAKASAQLASLGGEKGRAGDVAKGMAGVVRAQGKDVNDPAAMQAVAKAVTKAMQGTGQSATQVLGTIDKIFSAMPEEMRKNTTAEAMTSYSAAETVAGPGATQALQKYLGMSQIEKAGMEAQGFGKVFTKEGGLDIGALKEFSKSMRSRGLDMRGSLQTAGFSSEEAEGLSRLADQSDKVAEAMERVKSASDDYAKETRKAMGLGEAFQSNINKVKGSLTGVGSKVTQGLSDALASASETTGGAVAVTAGAGVLGALMAGGGLRGIGSALGGEAKKQAREAMTGQKVQDVYVTNASEIGGGGAAGAAGGMMGKAGGALAAGAAGYAVGSEVLNPLIDKFTQGKTDEGFEGNAVERLMFKLDQLVGGETSKQFNKAQEVHVKLSKELEKTKNSRGATYGPSK